MLLIVFFHADDLYNYSGVVSWKTGTYITKEFLERGGARWLPRVGR